MPGAVTEPGPRISATRSRQGSWGRHVLVVLVVSTALAAGALFFVLAVMPMDKDDLAPAQTTAAERIDAFDKPVAP